jgi:hypothetical protein
MVWQAVVEKDVTVIKRLGLGSGSGHKAEYESTQEHRHWRREPRVPWRDHGMAESRTHQEIHCRTCGGAAEETFGFKAIAQDIDGTHYTDNHFCKENTCNL